MVLGPISLDIGTDSTDHQKMTELEYQEAAALQGVENACQTTFQRCPLPLASSKRQRRQVRGLNLNMELAWLLPLHSLPRSLAVPLLGD